jgi:DNA-binding beta-propeller fold protein YncE
VIGLAIVLTLAVSITQVVASDELRYGQSARYAVESGSPATDLAVETSSGRLVALHGSALSILDAETGDAKAELALAGPATGLLLVPEKNRGYVSLGSEQSVLIVDLEGAQVAKTLEVPQGKPGPLVYDAASQRVFAGIAEEAKLVTLDLSPDGGIEVVATPGPVGQMVANGRGQLFGIVAGQPTVFALDSVKLASLGTFPVPRCTAATDIALDATERRLFVTCDNERLLVLDSDTGTPIAELPIGKGSAKLGLDFKEDRLVRIFVATPDGKLTVGQVQKVTFSVLEVHENLSNLTALGVDDRSGRVFLASGPSVLVFSPQPKDPKR